VFIDNASTDGTREELLKLVAQTEHQSEGGLRVKVIFNQHNSGHVRSPYHGLLAVSGDAVIEMASDLQDPPELIPAFVEK
jgi:glycosyltransferase involved in cell wall biosynthesis